MLDNPAPGTPLAVAMELGKPVRLKTWSLIVTLFGDAIMPRGGVISAASLTEVMGEMGIEAGAVRTAISRLSRDGWVERERTGRASHYRLAKSREAQFAAAAEKIYPGPMSFTGRHGDWVLVWSQDGEIAENSSESNSENVIDLGRDWALVNMDQTALCEGAMVYRGSFVEKPDWFQSLLAPPSEADAMRRLITTFEPVEQRAQAAGLLAPIEALALRILLIHAWRRIALRLQGLPPSLLPEDWPEAECRNLVARLYQKLLDRSEMWLQHEAVGLNGKLPVADYQLYERFH